MLARLFRFYPIVAVGAIAAAFLAAVTPDAGTLLANFVLLDVSLNPPLWSLQVELLAVPVILALYFAEKQWGTRPAVAFVAVSSGLVFVPNWAVWPALSTTLFVFPLGMLVPTVGRTFAVRLTQRKATVCVIGSTLLLFTASPCFGPYSRFTELVGGYSGAMLLSLVAYRTDLRLLNVLDVRFLRKAGAASGSFYVLHMLIFPSMLAIAATLIPSEWSLSVPALVGIGVISIGLVIMTPFMLGVSLLVEEPGITLSRRVARTLGREARPKPPVTATTAPARLAA